MIAAVLIALVRVYQATLSKLLLWTVGPVCRFEPSCSRYAVACLRDHGALRGTLLSVKRLCRCHPFHPGGYDPPPPAKRGSSPGDHARPNPPLSRNPYTPVHIGGRPREEAPAPEAPRPVSGAIS